VRITPRFSSRRWPGWGVVASLQGLPVELLMLVMLFGQAAPYAPWKSSVQTAFAMGSVFFLARSRPASMPPVAAFIIGLLHDLFGAMPVGVGILGMLLVQSAGQLTAEKRRLTLMGNGWLKGWMVFIPAAIVVALFTWIVMSVLSGQLLPLSAPLKQGGAMIILYPVVALCWSGFQRLIDRPSYA
jgi:rod shape-determining protein MreD